MEQSLLQVAGGSHAEGAAVEGSGGLQNERVRGVLLAAKGHQDRSLV